MIKNIVFDFGGVIVDIDRDKAVQAFIKLGLTDADSRLDKYHQTGIFQELEEGKLSADEFRKQLGDLCGRELTMEETKQAWLGFFNEVDLRKLDYMLELRKSYHVYILSNTNPFVMSWACSPDFSSISNVFPVNNVIFIMLHFRFGDNQPPAHRLKSAMHAFFVAAHQRMPRRQFMSVVQQPIGTGARQPARFFANCFQIDAATVGHFFKTVFINSAQATFGIQKTAAHTGKMNFALNLQLIETTLAATVAQQFPFCG